MPASLKRFDSANKSSSDSVFQSIVKEGKRLVEISTQAVDDLSQDARLGSNHSD